MTSAHFSWLPQDPRWDLQGIVEYSVQMRPVWCCILCPILCNACSLLGDSQSQQQFPLISGQDYWPTSTRVLQRNTSCGVAEWPKYAQGEQAAAEPGQLAWPRVRWGWSRWRWCYRPWATTEVLKNFNIEVKENHWRWKMARWFMVCQGHGAKKCFTIQFRPFRRICPEKPSEKLACTRMIAVTCPGLRVETWSGMTTPLPSHEVVGREAWSEKRMRKYMKAKYSAPALRHP